ncbi:Uncharacterised protein [Neisseria animaloris]|nr:Uncharacterised protein [Neisseria animaloris]
MVCRYTIVGSGRNIDFHISGVGSVQALQLVFSAIKRTIIGANLPLR